MLARQALALLLVLLLAFPAWGDTNIVGSVAGSQSATVRGTNLTPGSTIFGGDTIEVAARGSAWITLTGGAQVQVAENSQVRLEKTAAILAGVGTAIAALLVHRETRHTNPENCNAVSPFRCP